jgi:GTP cyclohydrolase III
VTLTPGRGAPSAVTFPVTVEVAIVCASTPVAAVNTTSNTKVPFLIDPSSNLNDLLRSKMEMTPTTRALVLFFRNPPFQ